MTQEEYLRRMQNDKYKELKVTTCKDNVPYVFISYKSDSWEVVLTKIAYRLQKEYGLRVYFDKSFNDNNNIWTEQFPRNMEHSNCKAVLAFIDNKYYMSYATLLELMYSQTYRAAIGVNDERLPVVPINLETIKTPGKEGEEDTGLGVEIFEDGSKNPNAEEEKRVFDETFSELKEREYLKKAKWLYKGNKLNKNICSTVMGEVYKMLKISDNLYKDVPEYYDSLVKTIKSVAPDVFEEVSTKKSNDKEVLRNEPMAEKEKIVPELPKPVENLVSLTYTDTIEDFEYYFKNLREEYKNYWQSMGNPGNTPSINIELKIYFNCAYLENYHVEGRILKSMFVEIMEYFYQMSGERYFDYMIPLCAKDKKGKVLKNPMIITKEYWSNEGVNQGAYSAIKDSRYLFYNWYGAPELLGAVIKQIKMYMKFLNENGHKASLDDVTVQYTFTERKIAQMMAEIRNAGRNGKKKGNKGNDNKGVDSVATVAFLPENLMNFRYRFKKLSDEYSEAYKKENNVKRAKPIPFSNISIHFPEGVIENAELKDNNWKPLFNKVMDAFCEFTQGAFCEWRIEQEMLKNNKEPLIISNDYYTGGNIKDTSRYQPICDGKYYFFNSYGAPELVRAMEDEIRAYMNYLAITKGCPEDCESVKISYELPEGYYADLFQGA